MTPENRKLSEIQSISRFGKWMGCQVIISKCDIAYDSRIGHLLIVQRLFIVFQLTCNAVYNL